MDPNLKNKIENFNAKRFDVYSDLYKHYSSLIFNARVSIITALFLSFGYIFKVFRNYESSLIELFIPIFTCYAITGIFIMEIAYTNSFLRVIKCLKKMEGDGFYFGTYRRKHWYFNIIYLIASIVLCTIYFIRLIKHNEDLDKYFFTLLGIKNTYADSIGFQVCSFIIAFLAIPLHFYLLDKVWLRLHEIYYKHILNWKTWEPVTKRRIRLISIMGPTEEKRRWENKEIKRNK